MANNMKKAAAYTLGCKVNQYESEAVLNILRDAGYEITDFDEYADVYIINTCTVTGLADRKCRQIIRRAKKLNPQSIIVAMGCYSQVSPKEVAEIDGVNLVIGTNERKRIAELLDGSINCDSNMILVGNIMDVRKFEELGLETYTEHTRAFLKIQDGCNRYCSYCIIPYARGPVRSRLPENITEEVKRLAASGYKEFVLTGIHLASYGTDLKNVGLIDILRRIAELDGVERIRLGSIEPMTVTEAFVKFAESCEKLCPHYHISLQSGSKSVLERMNRRYTPKEYFEKCNILKSNIPGISFTTDIIVGFPGETEEEFMETMDFAEKIGFSKIHVFKYSPRKGTKAASMEGQISNSIKENRSERLMALSDKMGSDFAEKMTGSVVNVLFERKTPDGNFFEGHCENYMKVLTECGKDTGIFPGDIKPVKIIGHSGEVLLGALQLTR